MICYLGLGSNLEDRKNNIETALRKLEEIPNINIVEQSSIIETKPFGKTDQPDFLNCVTKCSTDLAAADLLLKCLKIEDEMGRIRKEKWGARLIDIDILFYDDLIIETENLVIPHPGISKRKFVLESLLEICPDLLHPRSKKTIREIHKEL